MQIRRRYDLSFFGAAASAAVIAVTVGACSSAIEDSTSPPSNAGSGEACTVEDFAVSDDTTKRPEITVPDDCDPPSEMLSDDVVAGTGTAVAPGSDVEVHYELVGLSDGQQHDSSWDREQTFPMQNAGGAAVIEGWNQGVIGLKEGGRRLLVVPPALGYGDAESHPLQQETLVFVIDAVKVTASEAATR